ncbi:MAG: 2-hydroxyacyl-CoA dehydratase [Methanocorpusculum sp.]|jgi:predicted nucleotide-binding protein (sugar kinase/HSP70/actin superfamily)|nr:2-hydroxyacyl-CoA dehydratase [Methanocorpusculum sp.]
MAELVYDETGRLLFTEEMAKEYTLVVPQMLPVTFRMLVKLLELERGYHIEVLETNTQKVVETGLKYVHNDMCYPAILSIGQLIEAAESGRYDTHKLALMITQTGGGCRASNYIHLLRKALKKAGLEYIPVISINLSGMEKNPGFKLSLKLGVRCVFAMMYGDLLVHIGNQCRPYEVEKGATDALIESWTDKLVDLFTENKGLGFGAMRRYMREIVADFAKIERTNEKKPRVGIVGEIYVKYAPLGNNNLEEFLLKEGAEPVVPGVTDFIIFKVNNRYVDVGLYGGSIFKKIGMWIFQNFVIKCQNIMIEVIEEEGTFRPMSHFSELQELVKGYLGYGNKMGEGWLLTAEMLELIHSGTNNIVCTQPFGCLPNHVAGKGMMRKLKDDYPDSNIVAVDYDPGATKINQENRIKLMLANASRNERK